MLKQNTDYALRARLAEPYEAAVEKVTAALKEAGGPPEQLLQKRKKKA